MMLEGRAGGINCVIERKPWLDTVEVFIFTRSSYLTADGVWEEKGEAVSLNNVKPSLAIQLDVFDALTAAIQNDGLGLGDTSALADTRKVRDRLLSMIEKQVDGA